MTTARGFLGAGDLYVARYDVATASFGVMQGPFEAAKFEIKPGSDMKEKTSKGRDTYGQTIESVPVPKATEFSITFGEVNREALTLALSGTATAINHAAGTVSEAEPIEIKAKLGGWVELPKGNWSATGFKITNVAGTTEYTLDEDFEVNWRLGWVRALAGGDITDGTTIKVSGAYNAYTGTEIAGATQSQLRARFVLDGKNFADQLPVICTVHEAILTSDAGFDFLADDFAEVALTGRLKTPVGKSEPFKVEMRDSAA